MEQQIQSIKILIYITLITKKVITNQPNYFLKKYHIFLF